MVDPGVRCVLLSCRSLLVVVDGLDENISSSGTNPLPDVALVVAVSRHPRPSAGSGCEAGAGP